MNLSARMRVTIGLTCLLVSLMVTVISIGIGPNEYRTKMTGRAKLAESVAIGCTLHLNRDQIDEARALLRTYVARNQSIHSVGLRRETGGLVLSAGPHNQAWNEGSNDSAQVTLPLKTANTNWGDLEIKFVDDQPKTLLEWAHQPWPRYVLMVSCLGFFVISFYLGMTLKQLDPSRVVPKSVRVALDTIAEGLILTDRKGRVAIANQSFANWAGKDPDSFIGVSAEKMPWRDNNEGEPPADPFPWVDAMVSKEPQVRSMKLIDSENRVRSLIANSSPILGPDGTYRGVLTSFEDVSELEQHKRELSIAKTEADNANRAKSDFLARMSHEIRTPMNAILGYTEVLQDSSSHSTEERCRYLGTIQHSGEHLLALINDILDLSKVEAGQMELELRSTSTIGILKHVISVLSIRAKEKGIALDLGLAGKVPAMIMTDELRLKQTLINLVGNAIKFTDQGGVAMVARVENWNGKQMFCVDIGDTGIGMTPQQCQKIFDPFSQADTSITREYGGTGLGLAICKQLTEKMGGEISVKSSPGQGSVFTIKIDPGDLTDVTFVDETDLQNEANTQSTDVETNTSQFDGSSILIVDDSESNRELIALLLRRKGATLDFAGDGQEAIDKVVNGNFDVVLMDMQMPVKDGFTATRELRSLGHRIPIVACTANAMREDEIECRAAGCDGFLPKPINRKRLYECLEQILGTSPDFEPQSIEPQNIGLETATAAHAESATGSSSFSNPQSIGDVAIASEEHEPRDGYGPAPSSAPQTIIDEPEISSSLPMDDDEFRIIVELFTHRLRMKVSEMEAAAQNQNFDHMASLAHWLKGSGGTAGFHEFTDPARALELAAKAEDSDQVNEKLEVIQRMVGRIHITVSQEALEFI